MSPHTMDRIRSHGLTLAALTLGVPALWSLALPTLGALAVVAALVLPFVTMSILEGEVPHAGDAHA